MLFWESFDLLHFKKWKYSVWFLYLNLYLLVCYRLTFYLGKDMALTVGIYTLVQKAYKQPPIKLYRETNEPVKTKTRTFNRETGSLLLPSDTKRAQVTYLENLITLLPRIILWQRTCRPIWGILSVTNQSIDIDKLWLSGLRLPVAAVLFIVSCRDP